MEGNNNVQSTANKKPEAKDVISHDRALELLNKLITQMCEEEGCRGDRVCSRLADMGFTGKELMALSFDPNNIADAVRAGSDDEDDPELCPICGERLVLRGDEDDGYGGLRQYWKCPQCGVSGPNLFDMTDENNFVGREFDVSWP